MTAFPRLRTAAFWAALVLTAASSSPQERPHEQDDRMLVPGSAAARDTAAVDAARRAEEERETKGRGEEKDDPRARLEWQKAESGIPSLAFQANLLR